MRRRATLLLICGFVFVVSVPQAGGQSSIESDLLGLVNGGRSSKLVAHSGLRIVARGHSAEMSQEGGLNHDGAADRIAHAPPDPNEQNGAPDDGFTGTWCENVAYVRGAPENEIAQRVYEGWRNSSSHNRCMNDERMTAAGIGLYFDGDQTYWATLESAVDQTLPGSTPAATAAPAPTPTPTPTPEPAVVPSLRTEPPEPTERAEPTEPPAPTEQTERTEPTASPATFDIAPPVGNDVNTLVRGTGGQLGVSSSRALAGPVSASSAQAPPFGWAELGGTLGLIALVGEILRRLSRRRGGSEMT